MNKISAHVTLALWVTLLVIPCASPAGTPKQAEAQHLSAVKAIAALFEEYYDKYGTYPYSENWSDVENGFRAVPIVCNLSVHPIPERMAYPPHSCSLFSPREVENYLSSTLNRQVTLPKDNRPLKHKGRDIPFFYQLLIKEDAYYVSCYLNFAHDGTRELAKFWHKYQLGSTGIPERKIWRARDVLKKTSNESVLPASRH